MKFPSLYDPRILNKRALGAPLKVFLCGPGYESSRFDLRKEIRKHLKSYPNVDVTLGEELTPVRDPALRRGDLQTIEQRFVHLVDFTVLILESPGSIAELGSFSMIRNVRPRLFVMVPGQFFRSESYIARGPLSLIGAEHLNNIIYFDERQRQSAIRSLDMPVTLFKFANTIDSLFHYTARYGLFDRDRKVDYYESAFHRVKSQFVDTIVLTSILMLEEATFPTITALTKLNPEDIRPSLGRLFKSKRIARASGKTYVSRNRFNDPLFKHLNTTFLSKLRANYLTAA